MRINLATDFKSRTSVPDKDARQRNSYIEVKNEQPIVRKRPSAQGGVSVGSGVAQGGYGLVLFYGDTAYPITSSTLTTCNNATNYVQGDHVTVDAVDYWANTSTVNTCPVGGVSGSDWSTSYVSAIGTLRTYATWNPLDKGGVALSNGDLTVTYTTSGEVVRSTIGKSSGKWYWEILNVALGVTVNDTLRLGIATSSAPLSSQLGDNVYGWSFVNYPFVYPTAYKIHANIAVSYGISYSTGTIIGIGLDMDAGTIEFFVAGVSQGVAYTGLTGTVFAASSATRDSPLLYPVTTANFGETPFTYSVPSGYNSGLYT